MRVLVRARVYPTESQEKVLLALKNLFPTIDFQVSEDEVSGESQDWESLEKFREGIRARRIRDSIEDILNRNWRDGKTWIRLNKQDALRGVFNVSESSPLGDILVEIEVPKHLIHEMVWGSGDRGKVQSQ
jgi:predicted RNA binding protein with dsRBD fold (UPF0201 family)